MTIWGAAKACLGKYARFSGRASRAEYWKFVLFVLFVSPLMVIWWLSRPSQPGDNQFGPPPADPPAKA